MLYSRGAGRDLGGAGRDLGGAGGDLGGASGDLGGASGDLGGVYIQILPFARTQPSVGGVVGTRGSPLFSAYEIKGFGQTTQATWRVFAKRVFDE